MLYEAHPPSPHAVRPVSGGERYQCYKPWFLGLPNCDNPNAVDDANSNRSMRASLRGGNRRLIRRS
jgi:hypothetical protein